MFLFSLICSSKVLHFVKSNSTSLISEQIGIHDNFFLLFDNNVIDDKDEHSINFKKLYFLLNIVHAVQNAIEAFTTNASVRDKLA